MEAPNKEHIHHIKPHCHWKTNWEKADRIQTCLRKKKKKKFQPENGGHKCHQVCVRSDNLLSKHFKWMTEDWRCPAGVTGINGLALESHSRFFVVVSICMKCCQATAFHDRTNYPKGVMMWITWESIHWWELTKATKAQQPHTSCPTAWT